MTIKMYINLIRTHMIIHNLWKNNLYLIIKWIVLNIKIEISIIYLRFKMKEMMNYLKIVYYKKGHLMIVYNLVIKKIKNQ
jgi:hypothetical protein